MQEYRLPRLVFALAAALMLTGTGCQLMPHSLQPHQLWKLNRGPAMERNDAFFSIDDPVPPPVSDTAS